MTDPIVDDNSRRNRYEATAGQTVFTYTFPVVVDGDGDPEIGAYVNDVAAAFTADVDASSITLTVPCAEDDVVVIEGATQRKRLVEYPLRGGLPSPRLNTEMNKFFYMIQELVRDLGRSVRLVRSSGAAAPAMETPVGGSVLQYSADGTRIINGPSGTDIAEAGANAAIAVAARDETQDLRDAAALSAAAAAAAAAEGLYNEVISIAFANSPYVPSGAQEGYLFRCDCSGGNIVINLSALATYGEDMKFGFVKVDGTANTVTINRGGSNTIGGGTSAIIIQQWETHALLGDLATGSWIDVVQATTISDGSLALAKLATQLANTILANVTGGSASPTAVAIAANQFLARASSGNLSAKTITDFALSLLDDANAAAALTTLGVSSFMQTLLDDADAAAARATLGVTASAGTILAWVVFNGTGTPAIIAGSSNVASITDNGVGDYTVNFSPSLSTANYAVTSSFRYQGTSGTNHVAVSNAVSPTAAACRVNAACVNIGGASATDNDRISLVFIA